jgi:hypothetical protein
VKSPDCDSYPNPMRKAIVVLLLFLPTLVVGQPTVIATHLATLHERLSASCELIRVVTIIEYKEFDALVVAGTTQEIYSPELRKGDFVAFTTTVPKNVAKAAKRSGFEVRAEKTDEPGQNAKPITKGGS